MTTRMPTGIQPSGERHLVPVGRDQLQHVEMARDMTTRFNEEFGQTFDLLEALVSDAPKVPGIDGGER
jgi:tryptophanyl-tRNA synthetase